MMYYMYVCNEISLHLQDCGEVNYKCVECMKGGVRGCMKTGQLLLLCAAVAARASHLIITLWGFEQLP